MFPKKIGVLLLIDSVPRSRWGDPDPPLMENRNLLNSDS